MANSFCILHFTEGCQAYGHVCYGGHGKRSLNAGSDGAASAAAAASEQEYVRPNGLLPMLAPNEQAPVVPEADFDDYPSRQVLYKIMKSWVGVKNDCSHWFIIWKSQKHEFYTFPF